MNAHVGPSRRPSADLEEALAVCRQMAWKVGAFSFAVNLLLLAPSIYMLQVYDRVLTSGRLETLLMMTALLAGALLLLGVLDTIRSMLLVRMSAWFNQRLGPCLLGLGVRARLLGDQGGAQPLRELSQVQSFLASPAVGVFFDAPWTPVFIALIWLLHPWLGVLALGSAIVLLAISLINEFATRSANLKAHGEQITAQQHAEATIRNAEVVRAMGMLPTMTARWNAANDSALQAQSGASETGAFIIGLTKFIRLFVQSATLGLGAFLVIRNELSAGGMIAASILLGRALAPVEVAMGSWRAFVAARIAYGRLKAMLSVLPPELPRTRLPRPRGYLTLRNVSYVPPGLKTRSLSDVSFSLQPGEAVAVIGPSASGKTSLCRILVGIAQPAQGEVRLDGSELQHWDPDDLGAHIGYLPQDVELFAGTVRENIARMGEPDDAAVVRAAVTAHAHEMIQRLPQGYDTPIGDGGARLSGGQRQRIGLARAIYGNPRIIILDEPNANLDQRGESALAAAIADLKAGGAALVIVGHRPSTLAQADKVLVLSEGRVEVFGTRSEIVKTLRAAATAPAAEPKERDEPAVADVSAVQDADTSEEASRPAADPPRLPRVDERQSANASFVRSSA